MIHVYVILSSSEDDNMNIQSRRAAIYNRSPDAKFYDSLTRHSRQPRSHFTNQDAHWDLDVDLDYTRSSNRGRHGTDKRSNQDRVRKKRYEREWAQRRYAMVRDKEDRESQSIKDSLLRQVVTSPVDFNLGQAEMQEFDGLLSRRLPHRRDFLTHIILLIKRSYALSNPKFHELSQSSYRRSS